MSSLWEAQDSLRDAQLRDSTRPNEELDSAMQILGRDSDVHR